jgi:hypothetical protein
MGGDYDVKLWRNMPSFQGGRPEARPDVHLRVCLREGDGAAAADYAETSAEWKPAYWEALRVR